MPKPYSVDDLNRVIQEFRDYNEQNIYSEDDARNYLFERALETGELDEDVIRAMEDRYSNDYDLVVDDRPEFDLSEARFNRNLLDVSDYGGRIPYRGLDIDTDYEDYRAYNFLNADPKYRAFLEQQILELPDRSAAQEEVLNALRTGAIDSEDLNSLRTTGYSEILENVPENSDNFAYELADELNRAATSNEQTPSFRNIYSNAAESLNNLDPITTLPQQIQGIEAQRRAVERAIRTAQSGRVIQGNFPGTREQLELDLQQEDPRDALIRRAQQAINESQEPLSSSDIAQQRNVLYELQRDLNSLASNRAIRQAARRNLVLPAVADVLSDRDIDNAIQNDIENYEIQQRISTPDPYVERARESDEVLRAVNADRSRMVGVAPSFSVDRNAPRQLVIPGLNEEISNIARQALLEEQKIPIETLRQVVSQYPEVETLLNTELSTSDRPRLRGSEAKQYLKYVDTAQVITSPEDRADLYRKILSTRNVSDDLIKQLNNTEQLFTSGDPDKQRFAIQSLNDLGVGRDLNIIADSATSSVLPIVGGGGYIRPRQKALEFLDDRSQALRRAFRDVDLKVLTELYPGISSNPQKIYKQEFTYDPKTESVQPLTPGLRGDLPIYGIDMRVSQNPGIDPASSAVMPSQVSANVFRFLQDNPILNRANITFTTKAPGTGYNMDEKNLPTAVSRAFAQFAQQNALKDLKPGTLVTNSPLGSMGLYRLKVREGETPQTSSTLRKLQPFVEEGYSIPNLRGAAYQSVGFGPTDETGIQYTYIDQRGNAVPLQMQPAEQGLSGKVRISPEGTVVVKQGRLPKTTKAYYSLDPTTPVVEAIRQNPRGAAAGAALSLLNDEVARAIEKDDVAGAAKAFGVDVGTGVLSEAAIKGAGNILTRVAPQVAATVNPAVAGAASIALPAVIGAGLIGQGRDDSALNVLTRKAADVNAKVLPFTRTDPQTDIGRRLGQQIVNEGRYIFNRLRRNQIPYLSGQRFR